MLMREGRQRRAGRPGGKARGGGGAPEVGVDGAEEEDGEEANARRSPEGWGRLGAAGPSRVFWGPMAADRRGGGRQRRWVNGRRIPGGRRRWRIPGSATEDSGREDDGSAGGGHDDDDDGGPGTKKWPSAVGGGSMFYI
jgi:hypothetical protein